MASRKRLYTKKTLDALDIASTNADKVTGILNILEGQLKEYLDVDDQRQDVEAVIWTLKDLVFEIKKANDDLNDEEIIYADTLEEYLAEEKAEREQVLSS
jgi:hypothetical protein